MDNISNSCISASNLIDTRAARDLKDCLIQSPYFTDEKTHLYKG